MKTPIDFFVENVNMDGHGSTPTIEGLLSSVKCNADLRNAVMSAMGLNSLAEFIKIFVGGGHAQPKLSALRKNKAPVEFEVKELIQK